MQLFFFFFCWIVLCQNKSCLNSLFRIIIILFWMFVLLFPLQCLYILQIMIIIGFQHKNKRLSRWSILRLEIQSVFNNINQKRWIPLPSLSNNPIQFLLIQLITKIIITMTSWIQISCHTQQTHPQWKYISLRPIILRFQLLPIQSNQHLRCQIWFLPLN
jgi:hypothetical protein